MPEATTTTGRGFRAPSLFDKEASAAAVNEPHYVMPVLSADELVAGLETVLRSRDEIHEFWYDRDAQVFWAGDQGGDSVVDALTALIQEHRKEERENGQGS